MHIHEIQNKIVYIVSFKGVTVYNLKVLFFYSFYVQNMYKYETYEDFLGMNENINISEIDFFKAGYKSIYDVLQSTILVI